MQRIKKFFQLSTSAGTSISNTFQASDWRWEDSGVRGFVAHNTDATAGATLKLYAKSIVSVNDPDNTTGAAVTIESLYASYTSASTADIVNGPFESHYFRTSVGDWNVVWYG